MIEGEKALALASRQEGAAFESYTRMQEDQTDPGKVKAHLRRDFMRGERNRETAMVELGQRNWREDESAAAFAHDTIRLAILACPDFAQDALYTVCQRAHAAIRREEVNATKTVQDLAEEVTRLKIAEICTQHQRAGSASHK